MTAVEWLKQRIDSQRTLIKARQDDIQRADKSITEALAIIAQCEADLEKLNAHNR